MIEGVVPNETRGIRQIWRKTKDVGWTTGATGGN